MKTLETLYQEILSSDELKASFAEAAKDKGALVAWLKAQDCNAAPEDVQAFVKAKATKTGELSDDEISAVAGGCSAKDAEILASIFTAGVSRAVLVAISAANGDVGGSGGKDGEILCYNYDPKAPR